MDNNEPYNFELSDIGAWALVIAAIFTFCMAIVLMTS